MEQTGQSLTRNRYGSGADRGSSSRDPSAGYDELMRLWVDEALIPQSEKLNRENARQLAQFEENWNKVKAQYSAYRRQDVDKYVRLLLQLLSRVQTPDLLSLRMTRDESVLFQLNYPNRMNGYVELHFGEPDSIELVFNLYRNKQLVKAYGGTVEQSLGTYLLALNA